MYKRQGQVTNQNVLIFQDFTDGSPLSIGVGTSGGQLGYDGNCGGNSEKNNGGGNNCGSLAIAGVIAQAFKVPGAVSISVGGSGVQDYPGTIYAPGAPVEIVATGQNGNGNNGH